jgi:hypothetical protein
MWLCLWRLTVFIRKYRHAGIREGAVIPGFNIIINEHGPVNEFSEKNALFGIIPAWRYLRMNMVQ